MKWSFLISLFFLLIGLSEFGFSYKKINLTLSGDLIGLDIKYRKKFEFEKSSIEFKDKSAVARVRTRGQTCLSASRKCFGISMKENLKGLAAKFKLVSLSEDHGYMNYVIGLKFMDQVNMNKLNYEFIHVYVNQISQGLYLMIDDPESILIKKDKAVFIAKRAHWYKKDETKYYDEKLAPYSESDYLKQYKRIIKKSKKLKGRKKHLFLTQHMNINAYFDWLAVNSLLRNGDYDDELFYFAKARADGKIYFDYMGWDYEDLFSKPHLTNKLKHPFAIRKTILHSLVRKLDYSIYKDTYEYKKFVSHMNSLIVRKFTPSKIREIFNETYQAMKPYLTKEILKSSTRDMQDNVPYSKRYIEDLWLSRLNNTLLRAELLRNYAI